MMLIIMRHGEAEEYREPDHTRVLSAYGIQQSENVGTWLQQNLSRKNTDSRFDHANSFEHDLTEPQVDLALVSPYVRTQQTFAALAKHLKVIEQKNLEILTPSANASKTANLLHAYACGVNAPKSILLVTHMPLVSLLSNLLCAGFNGQFFDTADTLVVNYSSDIAMGKQLSMFKGL